MSGKRILKLLAKSIAILILSLFFIISLFYINSTIYEFSEPSPFKGEKLFNPYENASQTELRANFHAHTVAWKKVTNGHNSEDEVYKAYVEKGYDIAGISNYHSISNYGEQFSQIYVPVYEHGYNIFKSHCLAINPNSVSYFDYPLLQSTSHKQKIIENIKANNGLVVLAHPKFAGGRTFGDMESLVHYDFIEVLNHYRISDEYWDKALSAGKLAWVMGNDDTHDLVNEPTFRIWNYILSEADNKEGVLKDMKAGKNYAVNSRNGQIDNSLSFLKLSSSNGFKLKLDTIADSIQLIGQNGRVLKTVQRVDSVDYIFEDADSYVRCVAYNRNSDLYFNPILRYNGKRVPLAANIIPESRTFYTWLIRLFFLSISIGILFFIRKVYRL